MSGVDGYLEDLTNKLGDSDDQMEIEDTQIDDYQPNESDLEEDRDDRILENDPQLKTRKKRHQAPNEDSEDGNIDEPEDEIFYGRDQENDNVKVSRPKKTRKSKEIENLEDFFSTLPKVESHYCRQSSKNI
ncbi:hypothetical protein J6590_037472 [Homalodisca vitripennis]|nr:hypothetical protein J6590_037472 [Homalodisca vitripennis]